MRRLNPRLSTLPLALTIGFLAAGLGSSALANAIPDAKFTFTGSNGLSGDSEGIFNRTSCDSLNLCQTTMVSLSYDNNSFRKGNITTQGFSNDFPAPEAESQVTASMTFWFGVFGTFTGSVPLVVGAESAATAEATPFRASSAAFMQIDVPGVTHLSSLVDSCADTRFPLNCAGHSSASGSFTVHVQPNLIGLNEASVTLTAGGEAEGGGFTAFIDPTIDFAPGFDSTGLTLMFSATPVPEPGTLLLLSSGIVGLVAMRGKRG